MNYYTQEAFFKAVSVSLECHEPGKDAYYDMQMYPLKRQQKAPQRAEDVLWTVVAQYSRNGAVPRWATKLNGGTRGSALLKYQEVLDERIAHGYVQVVQLRESDLLDQKIEALEFLLSAIPNWPGFHDLLASTNDFISEKIGPTHDVSLREMVMLTDLAFSQPEGIMDALSLIWGATEPGRVLAQLSPSVGQWARDTLAGHSSDVDAKLEHSLKQTCAVLATPF